MPRKTGLARFPPSWQPVLEDEPAKPYFAALQNFVAAERAAFEVHPPADKVYAALEWAPFDKVKVVILGQDPYHDEGQAHGLAFSVPPGVRQPPSLINIFKELQADFGFPRPKSGNLVPWARQGVLLLNAVLTVRAHTPNSHRNKGWEIFTDTIITKLNARRKPIMFVLWGAPARKKKKFLTSPQHARFESAHPSPLSAQTGFFGSKPFSTINRALSSWGQKEIDWRLPD